MIDYLPNEVLIFIFSYLSVGDLKVVRLVCQQWRDSASLLIRDRFTIMPMEDIVFAMNAFQHPIVNYKHWVFKNVDLSMKNFYSDFWENIAEHVLSLSLIDVDMSEKSLLQMLKSCINLEHLCLAGFSHIFMVGNFLSNYSDLEILSQTLKNIKVFRLSCSRYLTDAIFSRLLSTVGPLKELCLSGCQIAFQNSIWKRFYPETGSVESSDLVFTFRNVLKFIDKNKHSLTKLSLNRTSIDSQSLAEVGHIAGLRLSVLNLRACDQLTKSGIQLLSECQKNLIELDISLCPRVTDHAVIAVADNLPGLKKLSIRRCHSVTEIGLSHLSRLRLLEELDISHLDIRHWDSVHEALVGIDRPGMKVLNLASLPISKGTVSALPSSMPNLTHLDLTMCFNGVQDHSIQALCKSLVHLRIFLIGGCSLVSDVGLSGHPLASVKAQACPDITGNQISLAALGLLEKDPLKVPLGSKAERAIREEAKIRQHLEESVVDLVKTSDLCGLANLRGLTELNLCGCVRLSDITLCHAFKFRELRSLNLSHCQLVTEEGLIQMSIGCPAIEVLLLVDCYNITDKVVLAMSHRLQRLNSLDLQRCVQLTDDSLDSMSCLLSLRYLDVSGCLRMSLEGVRFLEERVPRLVNFHHRGIKSIHEESGQNRNQWAREKSKSIPPPPTAPPPAPR